MSILAVVLAACGTTGASTPESTATPPPSASPDPSTAPSESPDTSVEVDGTLTMVDGVSVGGPGGSIADALDSGLTEPMLVNGVIYKDTDGTIYLAASVTDAAAPTFGGPVLEVVNYPDSPADWDMENAELLGLQEANGVIFNDNAQLYGVVAP